MRSLPAFAVAASLILVAAPVVASDTAPPAPLVEFLGDLLAPETTIEIADPVFGALEIGSTLLRFGETGLAEIATATGGTVRRAGQPVPLSWICLLIPASDGEARLLLASDSMDGGAQPLVGLWMDRAPAEEAEREGCSTSTLDLAAALPGLCAPPAEIAARFGVTLPDGPVVNIVNEQSGTGGALIQHLQYRLVDGRIAGFGLSQIPL